MTDEEFRAQLDFMIDMETDNKDRESLAFFLAMKGRVNTLDDAARLIIRLARRLPSGDSARVQATDFLKRHQLISSPLRGEKDEWPH